MPTPISAKIPTKLRDFFISRRVTIIDAPQPKRIEFAANRSSNPEPKPRSHPVNHPNEPKNLHQSGYISRFENLRNTGRKMMFIASAAAIILGMAATACGASEEPTAEREREDRPTATQQQSETAPPTAEPTAEAEVATPKAKATAKPKNPVEQPKTAEPTEPPPTSEPTAAPEPEPTKEPTPVAAVLTDHEIISLSKGINPETNERFAGGAYHDIEASFVHLYVSHQSTGQHPAFDVPENAANRGAEGSWDRVFWAANLRFTRSIDWEIIARNGDEATVSITVPIPPDPPAREHTYVLTAEGTLILEELDEGRLWEARERGLDEKYKHRVHFHGLTSEPAITRQD